MTWLRPDSRQWRMEYLNAKSILKLIRVGFPDKYGVLMKKRNRIPKFLA